MERRKGEFSVRLSGLRWWAVFLPTATIILIDYLADYGPHRLIAGFVHSWPDEAVLLLGVLIVAFGTTQILFQRMERSQQREAEAETLRQVGVEVTSNLEMDSILAAILLRGRETLSADCLGVALTGSPRRELTLQTRTSAAPKKLLVSPGTQFPWETLETGESREIFRPLPLGPAGECPSCRHCLALPLKMGSQLLGTLCAGSNVDKPCGVEKRRLATQMANVAAVAIANGLLHDRAQALAALEERDLIAREMHDSLAQTLSYLSMKAQSAREQLRRRERQEVDAALAEIQQVADDTYVDVREAIVGLRVSARAAGGLKGALEEYLQKFSRQSGVPAQLEVQEGFPANQPLQVELQLVRVVQEALTNVRKHAHATNAWVKLERQDSVGRITVGDDGRGFVPTEAEGMPEGRYGIATMRERIAKIGGRLAVESEQGGGTTVTMTIPLRNDKEGSKNGQDSTGG